MIPSVENRLPAYERVIARFELADARELSEEIDLPIGVIYADLRRLVAGGALVRIGTWPATWELSR